MPTITVADYAAAAALGDADALGALYERYYDPLLRWITLRTANNITVAEDISASVWERVARSIHSYTSAKGGFPIWLWTIARNAVLEHYRTIKRRPDRLDGDMLAWDRADGTDGPEAVVARRLLNQQIAAAVQTLSPSQRRCLTFRFYVGLSLAETADAMGKNINTIKQLQHRALGTLRERLGRLPLEGYDAETRVGADEYLATQEPAEVTETSR